MSTTWRTPLELLKRGSRIQRLHWLLLLCMGMLVPLGFSPFHLPGAALLGISWLYRQVQYSSPKKAFFQGLVFGVGVFGLGISWVSISIHNYGHLAFLFASLITGLFVFYLALFPALCTYIFRLVSYPALSALNKALLFSGLWCVTEYLRAACFTGFPWLILGFGQIDTPLKYVLPIIGIHGISFLAVLAACCLTHAVLIRQHEKNHKAYVWLFSFIFLLTSPEGLKSIRWSKNDTTPISVGIIQANLSMRDKWDDALFWQIVEYYQTEILQLIGKKQLILLPESSIPLPAVYIQDFLDHLNEQAKRQNTAILYGIPEEIPPEKTHFYNTLSTLGAASGTYRKQHLVPFGEYIPAYLTSLLLKLNLLMSDMRPHSKPQALVTAHQHPFATLICYELAYPQLLRQQLPTAEWIVSLSDDGWFGHSLASYQHLQMAQALSLLTSRYQIVANNDGLSSIITPQGEFSQTLPAFSAGILEGNIYSAQGVTPWVTWGDKPILGLCFGIGFIHCVRMTRLANNKRKKSKR